MIAFQYVDRRERPLLAEWGLGVEQKAKLDNVRDLVGRMEKSEFIRSGLYMSMKNNIFKLKVHGKVQLRPMSCFGPIDEDEEVTLLFPAVEKGGKLIPRDAADRAIPRRAEVAGDPENRRKKYE